MSGGAIFVNYRRTDEPYLARSLFERLSSAFGEGVVFIDVDSIPPGSSFRVEIERTLQSTDILLAVVGPSWVDVRDERGNRRLDDPDDWVRTELETARRLGCRVIPVLAGGARVPSAADLPPALAWFADCQALRVSPERFESDARGLVAQVERQLHEIADERGHRRRRGSTGRPVQLATIGGASLIAGLAAVLLVPWSERGPRQAAGVPPQGAEWATRAGTLVWVPTGSYAMGSPLTEAGRDLDEGPVHEVTVSGLYVMQTEVSQGLWQLVMGDNPSHFDQCGSSCPVEQVSWFDAVRFANRLSEQEGLRSAYAIDGDEVTWDRSADGYRLLTEAEWEYVARGGEPTTVANLGWAFATSGGTTHPSCTAPPNGYGLCDTSGNVREWVWDWHGPYEGRAQRDPSGPDSGPGRVNRGGSWYSSAEAVRVANRYWRKPHDRLDDLGLRLARPVGESGS